ncbi:MAG: hypothetical protein ABSG67_18970 [Thermoguttaceae bacterium]
MIRSPDGSYDARDVVAWCSKKIQPPKLNDNELERILVLAAEFSCNEEAIEVIVREIGELRSHYGEHILLTLFSQIVDRWREQVRLFRELETDEETRRQAEELHRKSRADESAKKSLRIVTVCETCKKIRTGKQWKKGEPPPGFAVTYDLCPECER